MKKENKKMKIEVAEGFKQDMKRMFSLNPIYSVPRFFSDLRCEIRWAYQRVFRGYDDRWYWSFNHQVAKISSDVFNHLSKNAHSYPSSITYKKWKKTLGAIAEGFKAYQEIREGDSYMIPTGFYYQEGFLKGMERRAVNKRKLRKLEKKQKRGLELFAKWFTNFWD